MSCHVMPYHTIPYTGIRKRGKERETPKKKRPTLLKKVINAERERRKRLANELKENVAAEAGGESAAEAGGESAAEGMGEETEEEQATVSTDNSAKEDSTKTTTSQVSGPQPSVSAPYSDVQPPAVEEAEAGMSDFLPPECFTISGFRDSGRT